MTLKRTGHTFNPKGIDPAAHANAVVLARYRQRFGSVSPTDAWNRAISAAQARGLTEHAAIASVMHDSVLHAAYELTAANTRRVDAVRAAVARVDRSAEVRTQTQFDGSTVITVVLR